jgi:hypothetical protein
VALPKSGNILARFNPLLSNRGIEPLVLECPVVSAVVPAIDDDPEVSMVLPCYNERHHVELEVSASARP